MDDVFKDMNNWSSRRIEELMSWKRHHEACIEKIEADIKRLSGYEIDYKKFMEQIEGMKK